MKEWFEEKTISLVGNANSLFSKVYGEEIDNQDVVIRLNKAAMLYTAHDAHISHGTRTDVWAFWSTLEYKHFFPNYSGKKMHMGHQHRRPDILKLVDFVYPDNLYSVLKTKAGKHNNPTTGLLTLDYLMHCNPKKVYVYGFDWKESPTFTDPDRQKEKLCPHDFFTERKYCIENIFTLPNFELRQ